MENLEIHKNIYDRLNTFYNNNNIPNIIFHGESGSGKKTILFNFLYKIYDNEKQKLKSNVMIVNCSHGKGIKFIREELKFFAKTNLKYNDNIKFKTIVLLNADSLTNDAQSALRRCIELFSNNTRFFIIIEKKEKLLNPILSRFCSIYVNDYVSDSKIVNLHQYFLNKKINIREQQNYKLDWFENNVFLSKVYIMNHKDCLNITKKIYNKGYSCLDLIYFLNNNEKLNEDDLALINLCFHKIKLQIRNEELLIFYMLDFILFREDKKLDYIL
tara:strand:+ start:4009 stop:4824 length:816 start_codon:yes stop_codon:yes gene_type:complete